MTAPSLPSRSSARTTSATFRGTPIQAIVASRVSQRPQTSWDFSLIDPYTEDLLAGPKVTDGDELFNHSYLDVQDR